MDRSSHAGHRGPRPALGAGGRGGLQNQLLTVSNRPRPAASPASAPATPPMMPPTTAPTAGKIAPPRAAPPPPPGPPPAPARARPAGVRADLVAVLLEGRADFDHVEHQADRPRDLAHALEHLPGRAQATVGAQRLGVERHLGAHVAVQPGAADPGLDLQPLALARDG